MEKIFEATINTLLQGLYEKYYYDTETKDVFVSWIWFAYSAAFVSYAISMIVIEDGKRNKDNFAQGGIVIPSNKTVTI